MSWLLIAFLSLQEKKRVVKVGKKEVKPSSEEDKTKKQYP